MEKLMRIDKARRKVTYHFHDEYCGNCVNENVMTHRRDYVHGLRRVGMHKCQLNSLESLELTLQKAARASPETTNISLPALLGGLFA
jgi:hypothetical protein